MEAKQIAYEMEIYRQTAHDTLSIGSVIFDLIQPPFTDWNKFRRGILSMIPLIQYTFYYEGQKIVATVVTNPDL